MSKKILSLSFFLLFLASGIFAQSLFADNSESVEASTLHVVADDESGIFFTDPENKVCFIDFSEINGYAKHLIVKNKEDEVIVDEMLWDLPQNSIYELDFEEYKEGNYEIELHTYTSVINKKMDVR